MASIIVAVVEVVVAGFVRMLIHAFIAHSSVTTSRTSRRTVVIAPALSQLVRRTVASFKHLTNRVFDVSHMLNDVKMKAGVWRMDWMQLLLHRNWHLGGAAAWAPAASLAAAS